MSVAGRWNLTMDTPIGTQKFSWNIHHDGNTWSGTMDSQGAAFELKNLKVNGDSVAFDTLVNSPMGAIHLDFNGAVVGDTVSGTCKTMFGDNQFSGQRG